MQTEDPEWVHMVSNLIEFRRRRPAAIDPPNRTNVDDSLTVQQVQAPSLCSTAGHPPALERSRMRGSRSLFSAAQTFQFGAPHTLCSSSSLYIRPLATPPPQASTSAPMSSAGPSRPASATSRPTVPTLSEAFQLFPAVYTSAEVEQLLRASLWKLDRVDTARRRRGRRRTGGSAEAGEVSVGGTRRAGQEAFEGEYGFEDVRLSFQVVFPTLRRKNGQTRNQD